MSAVLHPEVVSKTPATVIDITAGGKRLTKDEALRLTDEIRSSANRLWVLVAVAHDRGAWKALGYSTWKDYVTLELGLSESRSYQLIDTGRVMRTISEATGLDAHSIDPVSARTVAKVKEHLPALRKAIAGYLADNPEENPADVVEAAIAEIIPRPAKTEGKRAARGGGVVCPVCQGGGDLGVGPEAEALEKASERWLKRYIAR